MIAEPIAAVQPPPLPVTTEHAKRWQKALDRATTTQLQLVQADYQPGIVERVVYRISSTSQPELLHHTSVQRHPETGVLTFCDCQAGAVPIPCTHAALAVDTAGWWPAGVLTPVASEPTRPEPIFRIGAAVKIGRRWGTYWVTEREFRSPYGTQPACWCYLIENAGREPVRWYAEAQLVPAIVKRSVAA